MSLEYQFTCPLKHGMHARPATELSRRARAFRSDVRMMNGRTGQASNAKSLLSIIGADFRYEDTCVLAIAGDDQAAALRDLKIFIERDFTGFDVAVADVDEKEADRCLPPSLRMCDPTYLCGRPVVLGLAVGTIVHLATERINPELIDSPANSVEIEVQRLAGGFKALISDLKIRQTHADSREGSEILAAHVGIATDPEFCNRVEAHVRGGQSAAAAIRTTKQHYEGVLANTGSQLIEERKLDLRDVCHQLLRAIYGDAAFVRQNGMRLPERAIVVADVLTPQQFLELDKSRIWGLIVNQIGLTSHTAVLARAAGIPMIRALEKAPVALQDGQAGILDGDLAILVVEPTESIQRYYQREQAKRVQLRERQREQAQRQAATADGTPVSVYANAMSPDEVAQAIDAGADGIGLYRTEWMFLDRTEPPSEEEQYEILARAVGAAQGKPIVIRLLDVGGDKPVPYLNLPVEENPFLGFRGVRIYPEIEPIVRGQVRAILRASALGPVRMLVPMIATRAEMQWVRALVADVKADLTHNGIEFDGDLPIGAMIETPAAGVTITQLADAADFFSIGSNDLIQYLQAADRGNERVGDLQSPYHPGVVAFLKSVVEQARAAQCEVSICGEIAGQAKYLPLLLGIGLRNLSAEPTAVSVIKARISDFDVVACDEMVQNAVVASDPADVCVACEQVPIRSHPRALIDNNVVFTEADATSQSEAIKHLVDNLALQGRIRDSIDVEEAVWQREKQSSTAVGYGIAIPHCRASAVLANTISFMRLAQPVAWGDEMVQHVFMLTIGAADEDQTHMAILSQLARRIMQDSFRDGLAACESAMAVVDYIRSHIDLDGTVSSASS